MTGARTASVTQYASALNGSIKGLRDTWQRWQDAGCDLDAKPLACALTPMTLNLGAKTLVLDIQIANNPNASGYIGLPPDEILQLVLDTRTAAQQVDDDIDDDTNKPAKGWGGDVLDLMSVFDRWDPYLS